MIGQVPPFEIMQACSDMLEEFYVYSESLTKQTQGHGDLTRDYRSQLIGYFNELVDDAIFKVHRVKTDLFKVGETTGHFSDCGRISIVGDYVIVRGMIDTIDTDCEVPIATMLVSELVPDFLYEVDAKHFGGTTWRVSFKMDLEMISEFMYEMSLGK